MEPSKTHSNSEWGRLPRAWIFGDKLLSTSFKDAIADAVIVKILDTNKWPADMHEHIYPESSSAFPFRKLCVDIALWRWTEHAIPSVKFDSQWAGFFYYDYMLALDKVKKTGRQGVTPFAGEETCEYHGHDKDKPCYKTKSL